MNTKIYLKQSRENGYALLVTLVMLSLLAVILGSLARRSANTALDARDAEDDLRYRWAQLSCRHTLLLDAPRRFDARIAAWLRAIEDEDQSWTTDTGRPATYETITLELQGLTLWARVEDEQAKINLNAALRRSPDAAIAPGIAIEDALRPYRPGTVRVTSPEFTEALGTAPLASWAQVLPAAWPNDLLWIQQPKQLAGEPAADAITRRATLWGNGRLNRYTASDETLRRWLDSEVEFSTLDKLIRLRNEEPGLALRALIDNATVDQPGDRGVLTASLTDRSRCYAIWMAARPNGPSNAAPRWSLSVLESGSSGGGPGNTTTLEYRW